MTTKQTRQRQRRAGSALVIVMCFTVIIGITAVALYRMSTGLAFTVGNFRRNAQALAVAEAGVEDALQKLSDDFEMYKTSSLSATFGTGAYVVNITTNGQTGAIISSSGTYAGVTRETVLETLGDWESEWDTNTFGSYGIFCDGFVDCNGQGTLHSDLYTSDSLAIAPGCTIQGTVDAVGTVNNQGTIGGSTNEGVQEIEFPTFDFDYFVDLAGGDFINGDANFQKKGVEYEGGTFSGPDDYTHTHMGDNIMCIDGNVVIQNGAIITGCIIATGSIDMQGGHVIHAGVTGPGGEKLPSLMALGGNVEVRSGQTLWGYIYATGDVILNGGDEVHGGIICGGQFEGRNDWQVYPGDGEVPPGINPGAGGRVTGVRIGAWLK